MLAASHGLSERDIHRAQRLGDENEDEFFLPFSEFPWFREATIAQITEVEALTPNHLYWPALDVDLSVESIKNPSRFPPISKQIIS